MGRNVEKRFFIFWKNTGHQNVTVTIDCVVECSTVVKVVEDIHTEITVKISITDSLQPAEVTAFTVLSVPENEAETAPATI